MAQLNYTATQINNILAKANDAATTGSLANLNTTDKSSLVNAINESLTLAGLPSQIDNANKFLMTDGSSPSWENLGDSVSISGAIASFKRSRAGARLYPKIFFNPKQAGSGDSSPSNVRAISGWSQVNGYRANKNLIKSYGTGRTVSGVTFTYNDDGTITTSNTSSAVFNEICAYAYLKAGKYIISGCPSGGSDSTYALQITENPAATNIGNDYGSGATITLTKDGEYLLRIRIRAANVNMSGKTFSPMIRKYGDDGEFIKMNTATYPISLGNTYYGGHIDTQRGKIVVTKAINVIDGTQDITSNGTLAYGGIQAVYVPSPAKKIGTTVIEGLLSDRFKAATGVDEGIIQGRTTNAKLYLTMPASCTTAQLARTWFSNNPTQVCYDLDTPVEYDLADIPNITSLLGINNVFADSGDVEVTIPCDVASLDGNAKILPSQKTATIKEYSSAHTITKDDYSCLLLVTGATTITLPACDIGTEIEIMRYGTSTVTIAPSGVTINGSSSNQTITTQYVSKKLKCISNTAWVMT